MPTHHIPPHIFRAYDIRGLAQGEADDEITPVTANLIGRALATYLRELRPADARQDPLRIALGRDNRPTSEILSDAFSDGLRITPNGSIKSAAVDTYNDHRMAMSFALAGLASDGVSINDPECCNKTFPDFFDRLERMTRSK